MFRSETVVSPTGTATRLDDRQGPLKFRHANGANATGTDRAALALRTGGAARNLDRLRLGGFPAQSFASAFVDIEVAEMISQPLSTPVVPVPAAPPPPLLPGGMGMPGAPRARRRRART